MKAHLLDRVVNFDFELTFLTNHKNGLRHSSSHLPHSFRGKFKSQILHLHQRAEERSGRGKPLSEIYFNFTNKTERRHFSLS